jgi:hypothetical protein
MWIMVGAALSIMLSVGHSCTACTLMHANAHTLSFRHRMQEQQAQIACHTKVHPSWPVHEWQLHSYVQHYATARHVRHQGLCHHGSVQRRQGVQMGVQIEGCRAGVQMEGCRAGSNAPPAEVNVNVI